MVRVRVAAAFLAALFMGCTCTAWQDPEGIQLSLFGDQRCSDPVFDQAARQCCSEHDISFAVGGTEHDFHLANAEFLVCMLVWDVPWEIAYTRWRAVERFGWDAWTERENRTRGPPR